MQAIHLLMQSPKQRREQKKKCRFYPFYCVLVGSELGKYYDELSRLMIRLFLLWWMQQRKRMTERINSPHMITLYLKSTFTSFWKS